MPGLIVGGEDAVAPQSNRPNRRKQISLGSLFKVTATYALLFGGLQSLSFDPVEFGVIITGFTAILIGRSLLFRGRRPLIATALVGICLSQCACTWLLLELFNDSVSTLLFVAFEYVGFAIWGAALGLLTGCAIGSFHLVARPVSWALSRIANRADQSSSEPANRARGSNGPSPRPPRTAIATWLRNATPITFRRRPSRTLVVLAAVAIAITIFCKRPLQIAFHRYIVHSVMTKGNYNKNFLPMFSLFRDHFANPEYGDGALGAYHRSRDRLVELGYLVHREFIFEHVTCEPSAMNLVFKRAVAAFPFNGHTSSVCLDLKQPMHLYVWDRPSQIPLWEEFVRTQDVPMADIEPETEQDRTPDEEKPQEDNALPPATPRIPK
jgi:hypothetical protein